jgi:hypothetical protein
MFLRWQQSWTKHDRVQAKLQAWRHAEMELQSRAIATRRFLTLLILKKLFLFL